MILRMLLLASVILITACCKNPEVKYIDRPYEVSVPIKCIVPQANCNFNKKTDTEVINSLLECIVTMKHNQKVCE
jgi:hypothetical protein